MLVCKARTNAMSKAGKLKCLSMTSLFYLIWHLLVRPAGAKPRGELRFGVYDSFRWLDFAEKKTSTLAWFVLPSLREKLSFIISTSGRREDVGIIGGRVSQLSTGWVSTFISLALFKWLEAGLSNKSSSLGPAQGVTKFTNVGGIM